MSPRGTGFSYAESIAQVAEACAYYDVADVKRWFGRYYEMVGNYPRVYPSTIEDIRTFAKVPNEPFRKAFVTYFKNAVNGYPVDFGCATKHSEWYGNFRDELTLVRQKNPSKEIGPTELGNSRLNAYLHDILGTNVRKGKGVPSLAWLIQYEIGEVLCKTLGLVPIQCGI